jgi:hypothetical protein
MRRRVAKVDLALAALLLGLVLLVAAVAAWFVPYLAKKEQHFSSVAAGPGLFSYTQFTVPGGRDACMDSVTLARRTNQVQFSVRPEPSARGGPPLEVVLSAAAYEARTHLAGGYPGGVATLPIAAPPADEIGRACFLDRGRAPMLLLGTTEGRAISRSPLLIDGRQVPGDLTVAFVEGHTRSLLGDLSEAFGHAANLTDRLVPVWLLWILAVLAAFGIPAAALGALYSALRSEATARAS